jgi:hypothetical protein
MNKFKATLLALGVVPLAGCHTMTPALVGVDASMDKSQVATVWSDNTPTAFMEIIKANGKRTYNVITDSSAPYSVTLAPGKHVLSIFMMETQPAYPLDYKSVDMDVEVDLVAGHDYALRHTESLDGKSVLIRAVDLGTDKTCRYVSRGTQRPALECRSANGSGNPT